MRRPIKLALALTIPALLAACGIRGDLERPPPIFSDPPPEEARLPVDAPVALATADRDDIFYNSAGEVAPRPDPAADIGEDGLGEIEPG